MFKEQPRWKIASLRLRVLVIEQDVVSMQFIRQALGSFFDVDATFSGSLAADLLKQRKYDLVITSTDLPVGYRGLNVLRGIRRSAEHGETPVIGLGTEGSCDDRAYYTARGMTGYIERPLQKETLLAAVESALLGPELLTT